MGIFRVRLGFLVAALAASSCGNNNNLVQAVECNLYMANSTIPNAGLGIFSAIERAVGDEVGDGDICIPLMDLDIHHKDTFNPFSDYVWAGEIMGMRMEAGTDDVEALCPGLDCAINCNLALLNVGKATPEFNNADLHRSIHPGAGAITPYHNGTTKVKRAIPPGGELFKHYGDSWFTTRKQIFPYLPLSRDFESAEKLLKRFKKIFRKKPNKDAMMKDLYETVILPLREAYSPRRLLNALPGTVDEMMIAVKDDIGMIYQPNATRSSEWLEEHGKCVDHIVPKQSTIDGAGRGAFAKRDLPKGTVITGSPLHHIPFKETFFDMYDMVLDENGEYQRGNQVKGKQLVMNYCFGHPATSMALCPYGSGVNYINHNKTQANVKVVWAKHGSTSHNDEWFSKTPMEILADSRSRLGMDYVATRDIRQGEELFMDYGDEWEEAWTTLTTDWKMEHSWADAYLNAHQWNDKFADLPLRTTDEAFYDPYPLTMHLRCHHDLGQSKSLWKNKTSWKWKLQDYGFECDILERTRNADNDYVYTVTFETEPKDRWDSRKAKNYTVEKVPRAAIRFFDLPFTTDLHLRNAFRHEIGLPDELMQDAWRNAPKPRPSQPKGPDSRKPGGRPGPKTPQQPEGPKSSNNGDEL